MRVLRIGTYAEAMAASGAHPFVRYEFAPDAPLEGLAHPGGGAVALVRHSAKRGAVISLIGRRLDAQAQLLAQPELADLLFAEARAGLISVPAPLLDDLRERFRLGPGGDWEWMVTTVNPPLSSAEGRVLELGPEWAERLIAFLAQHNPRTDAEPFARAGQRWVGVVDDGVAGAVGELAACGCAEPNQGGILALAGITVRPDRRGEGLGAAVTAALTRPGVRADGAVTLGMYADNDSARRIYHALGYRTEVAFASRVVTARERRG